MPEPTKPVVVCVRHPGRRNQVDAYPEGTVRVVEVDLGALDGPEHFDRRDPEHLAWAAAHVESVAALPVGHPARRAVCELVRDLDPRVGAALRTDPRHVATGLAYGLTVGERS